MGRVLEHGSDYLGRSTRTVLSGKDGKRIAVYNCYTPCKGDPAKKGESRIIRQLFANYIKEGRKTTDPRRNHYDDLQEALLADVAANHSIILGGDFNGNLLDHDNFISGLIQSCKLVDPIWQNHGISNFNTHINGSKVIDYIFISEDLQDAVLDCGYHPFCAHFYSDHRACFVDFDTKKLFGSDTPPLPEKNPRLIHSAQKHQVTTYIEAKMKLLQADKFFQRLESFQAKPTKDEAEALDVILTKASLEAAQQCKTYPPPPYSPQLTQLRLKFQCLTLAVFGLQNDIDMTQKLALRRRYISDSDFSIPATLEACKQAKRTARKALRHAETQEYKTHKLRQEYLLELQAKYDADGEKALAKTIKRLHNAEATR